MLHVWLSLNRDQKESIILLQIGTFLEYFDLMLYVQSITVAYLYGVRHFERLERRLGWYPNLVGKAV